MKVARETSANAQNELQFSQLFLPSIYLSFSLVEHYTSQVLGFTSSIIVDVTEIRVLYFLFFLSS